jgi:hypothetical protein
MKDIQLNFVGYGHYRVTTMYYGKEISCVTTNMRAVDDYNSDDYEKDGRQLRKRRGYNALRGEVVRKHQFNLV